MLTLARYGTNDRARATRFYDAIAALLGTQRVMEREEVVACKGADGGMFLIGKPFAGEAGAGNGTRMGFAVPGAETVDAVYAKAIELVPNAPARRGRAAPTANSTPLISAISTATRSWCSERSERGGVCTNEARRSHKKAAGKRCPGRDFYAIRRQNFLLTPNWIRRPSVLPLP